MDIVAPLSNLDFFKRKHTYIRVNVIRVNIGTNKKKKIIQRVK